ncbi:10296_t:CDS:2 [Ambispora gerdemannii]|uniref:10296_t:CDS:1 n=1 Tax=Ambispora gerdemannii TaxID=144530 RepID=A0A9N9EY59_9GLOM|nr:10296_t:CDS:2 [Ambispora gerdemannii]
MEEIQQLLTRATDNLSTGNVKDAYFSYISALDLASKELQSIKFINNVVTSKPPSISSVFTISRKCLAYAEDIIVKNQPLSPSRKNPNLNIAIYPPTPQEEHSFDQINKQKVPRIPPKPRRSMTKYNDDEELSITSPKNEISLSPQLSKPPLPPKPTRTGSLKKYLKNVEVSGVGRDAQVLPPDKKHENIEHYGDVGQEDEDVEEGVEEGVEGDYDERDGDEADTSDSDDEDEDDEYLAKNNDAYRRKSDESLNVSTAPLLLRRSSSPNLSVTTARRLSTLAGSLTDSPTDEESSYSSHILSPSSRFQLFPQFKMSLHESIANLLPFERRHDIINVVPEGAVDPNNLIAANVLNESENSQSPSSPSHSYSDHIPQIPASPLLIQHSQLEQKIQSLEVKLIEYRTILKTRRAGETDNIDLKQSPCELSDDEINEALLEYGANLASYKEAITRNRNLYFKAAADPSILDFAPHMIAYQLTLIESSIFLEIDPLSLLAHSPKNPDPKITASTDFFNFLTRVVERSILSPQEASARALVIHYWVKVAVKLHELHNYQTLKGILSALGTPPIKRLKRTWACIPKKSMTKLDSLNELMSESSNYGKYRETVQQEKFIRKPVIPFLGTFIMDATYLLAAVKSSGSVTPNSSTSFPSSGSSNARDDPRVQELLQSMKRYQTGPKYPPKPPVSYIKASTKHHFRTASISAALHRGGHKFHLRHDEDNETVEERQQLLTHYLLTRSWMPEKKVDELSLLREPQKHKSTSGSSNSQRNSANGGTWNGISIISNSSSKFRESAGSTVGGSGTSTGGNGSTSSGRGRTSSTSGSGESRPNSMGEGSEVNSSSSIVTRLEKAIPILEKDRESGSGSGGKKVGNFLFRPRTSLDRARDEKDKNHEKSKNEEFEKENDKIEVSKEKELNISNSIAEISSIITSPLSVKRTSWRTGAMRVMFGGSESVAEVPKSPSPLVKFNSDNNLALSSSRSLSGNEGGSPKISLTPYNKVHLRTLSSATPMVKQLPFASVPPTTRRSMDESRSTTPPPLLPKPAGLLHRSASTSSVSSRGSNSSISNGGRPSIILGGGTLNSPTTSMNIITMLARKVASEVAAASGGTLERNRE